MKSKKKAQKYQNGWTLFNLLGILIVVGVITAIFISNLPGIRDKMKTTDVLSANNDLQGMAMIFYGKNGIVPSIDQLDGMYAEKNKSHSIVDKFKIIPIDSKSGIEGRLFAICSTTKLADAAYVYSIDNNQPQVAALGTNPLGQVTCGYTGDNFSKGSGSVLGGIGDSIPGVFGGGTGGSAGGDQKHNIRHLNSNTCRPDVTCPCNGGWENHAQYASCVSRAVTACYKKGLITSLEKQDMLQGYGSKDCGN